MKRLKITVTVDTQAVIESNDFRHRARVDLANGQGVDHRFSSPSSKIAPADLEDVRKQVEGLMGHDNFDLQVAK